MRRPALLLAAALLPGPARAYTAADVHTPLAARALAGGLVALEGRIVPGSVAVARAALGRPGVREALLDSPGGSIAAALSIGRLVRARDLGTAVAHAGPGGPRSEGAACASACVLVLAAGVRRTVGPGARVGVHRLVDWTTYSRTWDVYRFVRRDGAMVRGPLLSRTVLSSRDVYTEAPPAAYGQVARYLAAMGETPELVALMRATPAAGLHWMTAAELRATRLGTGGAGALTPGAR